MVILLCRVMLVSPFQHLEYPSCHSLLPCQVSTAKLIDSLIEIPLSMTFSPAACRILTLAISIMACTGVGQFGTLCAYWAF